MVSRVPRRLFAVAAGLALLAAPTVPVLSTPLVRAAEDPVVIAAGDIADCTTTTDGATANLLDSLPGTVVTLGDNAYPDGSAANFRDCYGPTWGRHRGRTRPSPGNHDYRTAGASAYFRYFGSAAGAPAKGYYSYDLGAWHVVVLNSNCAAVGGCGSGSPQLGWLRADLAANSARHVLAYWHHPRFSSGTHGGVSAVGAFWEALYAAGADIVLNGHDHDYERFGPQDPWGRADSVHGIRQFVVGTGGTGLRSRATTARNSQVFARTHGVLRLTLRSDSYAWAFVPVAGKTFEDAGSGAPHGPPPPRTTRSFTAASDAWVNERYKRRNYGTSTRLLVDASTAAGFRAHTYIKVKVTGTSGVVDRAVLRLWVTNATRNGPTVAPTSNAWSGSTITWANRPRASGAVVADAWRLPAGQWADFDVTRLVRGNGTFSFLLRPESSDGLQASSLQGGRAPRLVVQTVPAGSGAP